MRKYLFSAVAPVGLALVLCSCASTPQDPYLWLEEIESPRALQWVNERNSESLKEITADPAFKTIEKEVSHVVLAKDRLPTGALLNGYVYNFWQDEKNIRGLWRRTSLAEYGAPHPRWDVLMDFDAIAKKEKENWVWKGTTCLPPQYTHCIVSLSRGGKDALVLREWDLRSRKFVKNGFNTPESKTWYAWVDETRILIATDWGPGTMTTSGYPRVMKLWTKGTPLTAAVTVMEVPADHMGVSPGYHFHDGKVRYTLTDYKKFYENTLYLYDPATGTRTPMAVPEDAELHEYFRGYFTFHLRKPWEIGGVTFPADSLVAVKETEVSAPKPELIFASNEHRVFRATGKMKSNLLVGALDNIRARTLLAQPSQTPGAPWVLTPFQLPGDNGDGYISSSTSENDEGLVEYWDFLTPTTIYSVDLAHTGQRLTKLRAAPARFDAKGMSVEQRFATSKDGTSIPYFLLLGKGASKSSKPVPTILYGYGGFENALTPFYSGTVGKSWLSRGGAYVVANIRGGGEFGARWHQAALRENRQKAFDDFAAIAEALIKTGVTTPKHLGIMGGSNGGLLCGATLTQRPELMNAAVCQVPLLDMLRFHKLLAGASWMEEYGNPEVASDREYIARYSPYQNLKRDARYPRPFVLTSTKDDRVHPGHARKFVAKLRAQGHDVLYFENTEGGHAAAANLQQRIKRISYEYIYLGRTLGLLREKP